LFLFSFINT